MKIKMEIDGIELKFEVDDITDGEQIYDSAFEVTDSYSAYLAINKVNKGEYEVIE